MLLMYFLNDFEIVPVAPIITGIIIIIIIIIIYTLSIFVYMTYPFIFIPTRQLLQLFSIRL